MPGQARYRSWEEKAAPLTWIDLWTGFLGLGFGLFRRASVSSREWTKSCLVAWFWYICMLIWDLAKSCLLAKRWVALGLLVCLCVGLFGWLVGLVFLCVFVCFWCFFLFACLFACLFGWLFCCLFVPAWLPACCICGIHGISFRSRSYLVRILFTSPSQFTFQYRKNEICSFTAPIDLCALRQPRKWYKIHAELQADYNKATNIFKIPREHFFLNLAVTLADASKSFIQRDQIWSNMTSTFQCKTYNFVWILKHIIKNHMF